MSWENLYNTLYYNVDPPTLLGAFHIVSLILCVIAAVIAVVLLKNASERTFRGFALGVWIILVIGEIYREVCFGLSLNDGVFSWDYAWYQFPFQLCSSPLYALPFLVFLKDGKLRDGFLSFMALWSFFGGFIVMLYPNDVLCEFGGINIQSMVHHGAQTIVGIVIAVRNVHKMDKNYFLRGFGVYFGYLCIAMILNIVGYHLLQANGMTDTFNMMFISPYFPCTLPLLSMIHEATSWYVLFPTYVIGFIIIALIIFFVQKAIITRCRKA